MYIASYIKYVAITIEFVTVQATSKVNGYLAS